MILTQVLKLLLSAKEALEFCSQDCQTIFDWIVNPIQKNKETYQEAKENMISLKYARIRPSSTDEKGGICSLLASPARLLACEPPALLALVVGAKISANRSWLVSQRAGVALLFELPLLLRRAWRASSVHSECDGRR